MRTSSLLKNAAHVVLLLGIVAAMQKFSVDSLMFWVVIVVAGVLWLVLRLLAIIGQLVYEMRNDSARVLSQVERSLYQINASMQEVRDLMDSNITTKDVA
ncbi:MAG: hypothetical protein V2A70_04580 [Candidatus Omnitrophota bacterium]